jgi:hypothetical protein
MGSTFFGNEAWRLPAQKNPARNFISLCQKNLLPNESVRLLTAKVIDAPIKKPGQQSWPGQALHHEGEQQIRRCI